MEHAVRGDPEAEEKLLPLLRIPLKYFPKFCFQSARYSFHGVQHEWFFVPSKTTSFYK